MLNPSNRTFILDQLPSSNAHQNDGVDPGVDYNCVHTEESTSFLNTLIVESFVVRKPSPKPET